MTDDTIEQFLDDIANRRYDYSSVRGIVQNRETIGTERTTYTAELWERPPDQARLEKFRSSSGTADSDGRDVAEVVVRNGNTAVTNDIRTNQCHRQRMDPDADTAAISRPRILASVISGTFDVSVEGSTTVAGQDVRTVSITPTGSNDRPLKNISELRLWVGLQYRFPLRYHVSHESGSNTIEREFEWLSVEFDGQIDDEQFVADSFTEVLKH